MTSAIDGLTGGATGIGSSGSLDQVLRRASAQTGVDFEYLLQTAQRESSLNPNLKATTSSATGLFQFIEQTWLSTIKSDGARFGLTKQAQQIEQNPDGRFFVRDSVQRQAILDLRKDPDVSSKLAGALTQRNAFSLSQAIGREPSGGELYIAHFLGAKGAINLINANVRQPNQSAVELFPSAAKANRPIFYEKNGEERSVGEVYSRLTSRHENGGGQRLTPPDPAQTLASHASGNNVSSGKLASGPEAAFLAGHFSGGVNAFAPQNATGQGVFGAVLGGSNTHSQKTFFAPNYNSSPNNLGPTRENTGVIPSRYARVNDVGEGSSDVKANSVQVIDIKVDSAANTAGVQDVTLYPSIFNEQETVVIQSSEFGKTDLPLDLSHYLKKQLPK
ncbi:MAG: lytic transglycosylase domain-containing protein [Hyphomicrobiales bacterium]